MKPKKPMQFKISREDERGETIVKKIELIAKTNGLSPTDVAKLALAVGLPMVETKMTEMLEPKAA